jgi:hypothetical protein
MAWGLNDRNNGDTSAFKSGYQGEVNYAISNRGWLAVNMVIIIPHSDTTNWASIWVPIIQRFATFNGIECINLQSCGIPGAYFCSGPHCNSAGYRYYANYINLNL